MNTSLPDWQDVADVAAWIAAGFLVLALVNALSGAVPVKTPPEPQIVRQPAPARDANGPDAWANR